MRARSSILALVVVVMPWLGVSPTSADELAYQWEADVVPHDPSAGWQVFDPCDLDCVQFLENGHFIIDWPSDASDSVNFDLNFTGPHRQTLWVEWRFKSNVPLPPQDRFCDGFFTVDYDALFDVVLMHGDAAVSFNFDNVFGDLELDAFHTYRYEGISGDRLRISVDGNVFWSRNASNGDEFDGLQFGGLGGCNRPPLTIMRNEWDFIRYGTMSEGEAIVSSIPAEGIVDANANPNLDRFTIVFDQPGYVYVDDVTVAVTGGPIPIVIKTRRAENHGPDTLEVVLDRPLTLGETTTFTFATGGTPNTVAYTYLSPGACCDTRNAICTIETQADCEAAGFVYGGDGTDCATVEPPCECVPDCTGRECGDDGCGGTCGTCQPCPEACDASGVCQSTCGNNVCEPSCGENCDTCPDCGCISPCERCVNGICVDVCGACCFEDEGCIDNVTSETCAERGGDNFQLRRTCDDRDGNGIADICDVPAVSIWCMVVLVLLLLAGMTIKFDGRIGLSDGG